MNIERTMNILEVISNSGQEISTTEIHKLSKIPKPSCYRTIEQLLNHELLDDPNKNNRYIIGKRLRTIVRTGTPDKDICLLTRPLLQETAKSFDEAVFLSRFRNNGVEIIHVETPTDVASSFVHPGLGFRPLHACSCSKAILAFSDASLKQKILNGPKKRYTQNTKISKTDLERELQLIQVRGYAECVEEIQDGIASVAVPIKVNNNNNLFSIGTIGPSHTFTERKRSNLGNKLIIISDRFQRLVEHSSL